MTRIEFEIVGWRMRKIEKMRKIEEMRAIREMRKWPTCMKQIGHFSHFFRFL